MVAAETAGGQRWWPGSLPGAVGVVMDEELPRGCVAVGGGAVGRGGGGPAAEVVVAAPYPRPIPGVPRERNLSGISFAVANVTGMLARVVEGWGGPLTREVCLEAFRVG